MGDTWKEPDWRQRLPGEQWLVLDSVQAAEQYLATLPASTTINRQTFPNEEGIYALFSSPGQVFGHKIFVSANNAQD
ncbi:MAG TPA: hypothetical protein V6C99_03115 [Oculatellaceae cyanobacterium]|jgi:hypothetical protein